MHRLKRRGEKTPVLWSELSPTGKVDWTQLSADANGMVALQPAIDWNLLVQEAASHEILEHQGWALTNLSLPRAGRYFVTCRGTQTVYVLARPSLHSTAKVDGAGSRPVGESSLLLPLVADMYGSGVIQAAADLDRGAVLYIHVRAKVWIRHCHAWSFFKRPDV